MLNGSIDIRVIGVSPLRDIASEKMIPPAIASTKPSPALPDVPSVAERLAALLKIEPPRGDEMRNLGPRDDVGRPIFYEAINAGKVARRMDLKKRADARGISAARRDTRQAPFPRLRWILLRCSNSSNLTQICQAPGRFIRSFNATLFVSAA